MKTYYSPFYPDEGDMGVVGTTLPNLSQAAVEALIAASGAVADGSLTPDEKMLNVPIWRDVINKEVELRNRAISLGAVLTGSVNQLGTAVNNHKAKVDAFVAFLDNLNDTSPQPGDVEWFDQGGMTYVSDPTTFVTRLREALETRTVVISEMDQASYDRASFALSKAEASISDGVLNPSEKIVLVPLLRSLLDSYNDFQASATAQDMLGDFSWTNYSSAITALSTRLSNLNDTSPQSDVEWDNRTGDTYVADPAGFTTDMRVAFEAERILQAALVGDAYALAQEALANTGTAIADNVITPGEKLLVVGIWQGYLDRRSALTTRATALGVQATTEYSDYTSAHDNWQNYLNGLNSPVAWNNRSGNTDVPEPKQTLIDRLKAVISTEAALISRIERAAGEQSVSVPNAYVNSEYNLPLGAQTINYYGFLAGHQEAGYNNTGLTINRGVNFVNNGAGGDGQAYNGRRNTLFAYTVGIPPVGTVWEPYRTPPPYNRTDAKRYAMAVQDGDRVFASALIARHRGGYCEVRLIFSDGDNGGSVQEVVVGTGGREGGGHNGDPANYDRIGGFTNVPSGMRWVTMVIRAVNTSTPVDWPWIFIMEPMLAKVPPGQTTWPLYAPGPPDRLADQTATNTASSIAGQGALATDNSVSFNGGRILSSGSNGNVVATDTGYRTVQGTAANITGQGNLATNNSVSFNSGQIQRSGGQGTATDAGYYTSQGTAANFSGQGNLATMGNVYFNSPYMLESNGGSQATLSNFKTNQGTAANISGQSAWATYTQWYNPSRAEWRSQYIDDSGRIVNANGLPPNVPSGSAAGFIASGSTTTDQNTVYVPAAVYFGPYDTGRITINSATQGGFSPNQQLSWFWHRAFNIHWAFNQGNETSGFNGQTISAFADPNFLFMAYVALKNASNTYNPPVATGGGYSTGRTGRDMLVVQQ